MVAEIRLRHGYPICAACMHAESSSASWRMEGAHAVLGVASMPMHSSGQVCCP